MEVSVSVVEASPVVRRTNVPTATIVSNGLDIYIANYFIDLIVSTVTEGMKVMAAEC